MIRQALELAAASGDFPWPDTEVVGGWWNRQFAPEVDLVGADRAPVAGTVHFAGSVKWLTTPFDQADLTALTQGASEIPGFISDLANTAIVSLTGTTSAVKAGDVGLVWGPRDVLAAWRP